MRKSKYERSMTPPLLVTLNLPSRGLIEREQRGREHVRRQHGFVDLAPERESIPPLNACVGHLREHDVRQRVGKYRQRVAVDVHHAQEQIDQWNREKESSRGSANRKCAAALK